MMVRAMWNGAVLAESDETRVVEGNYYLPPDSLRREYFARTKMHTVCPWKGIASYYTVTVDDVSNKNAAWCYPRPFPLARRIKNHVAFYGDVEILETAAEGIGES